MTTIILAKLWGPAILAVGLGIFVSRPYYLKIYRDLEKSPLAVLLFGMTAMVAGVAQIQYHNVWTTAPEAIISFLGWALLLKGILFVVWPDFVDKAGDWWVKNHQVSFAGVLTIIIGAYLSFLGYIVF